MAEYEDMLMSGEYAITDDQESGGKKSPGSVACIEDDSMPAKSPQSSQDDDRADDSDSNDLEATLKGYEKELKHSHGDRDEDMEGQEDGEDGVGGKKRHSSSQARDDEPASKRRPTEVEKLWKNVETNPADFQAWTLLLQHVDQVSDLESGRDAYTKFFARYPFCYGYWKKYAELEKRKGTKETTLEVFNTGLAAIPLSVDLWVHFLDYIVGQYGEDEEFVRDQFERAVTACGLEFKSDKMWEAYITWESSGKRWKNVTVLYERLVGTPVSKYLTHWQKFQDHVRKHLPSEVVGVEEFLTKRRAVLAELNPDAAELPDEAPPGVESVPGDETIGPSVHDEETKLLQKHIIDSRHKIHEDNVVEVKSRWAFEDAIKRPYFHVKPLEKSQLTAWRLYLESEAKQTDNGERVRVLFERCLIACALYEEFWMRYVHYLEGVDATEDEIRSVYSRACTIHLQEKVRPHLSWAAFEEERGDTERALEILADIKGRVANCLEAWMQCAAVERRRGGIEAAEAVFLACLDQFQNEKNVYCHVALRYARFMTLFKNDSVHAVEILQMAHELDKDNPQVIMALVDQALSCHPPNFDTACEMLRKGTDPSQQPTARMMFAHRLLHFQMEFGQGSNSVSEGMHLFREIKNEIRSHDTSGSISEHDGSQGTPSRQGDKDHSHSEVHRIKRTYDKPSQGVGVNVNGSGGGNYGHNQQNFQQPPPQQQTQANYNQGGYNQGGYNQGGGYGSYQGGWGYPQQQQQPQGYNYNQQPTWGNYGNYYGQR